MYHGLTLFCALAIQFSFEPLIHSRESKSVHQDHSSKFGYTNPMTTNYITAGIVVLVVFVCVLCHVYQRVYRPWYPPWTLPKKATKPRFFEVRTFLSFCCYLLYGALVVVANCRSHVPKNVDG